MAFTHEKLKVYQNMLPFNGKVGAWTNEWDHRHSITDQLLRASASILENIAMACATYTTAKFRSLDYAIGSTLECAACLDIALLKRLLSENAANEGKIDLSHNLRMLVGLRKSWAEAPVEIREDSSKYTAMSEVGGNYSERRFLFNHETLDVYRVGIEVAGSFCRSEAVAHLPLPTFRRLDELLTSMILNIAEGNGRFSHADQMRFLNTTNESALKLAARLDICATQNLLPYSEVAPLKANLERVVGMSAAMITSLVKKGGNR